jgi:hypothetical protein
MLQEKHHKNLWYSKVMENVSALDAQSLQDLGQKYNEPISIIDEA